jgi:ribosomal protein S18 acetylase RimI-like enzyme
MNMSALPVHIRWILRSDLEDVAVIESDSFSQPWSIADFTSELRQTSTIGLVAEDIDVDVADIVGFVVYRLRRGFLEIRNLAVWSKYRRMSIGRQLVDKLKSKLEHSRRRRIEALVSEANLDAHLFLHAMGFRCERIVRRPYENIAGDGYLFVYQVLDQADVAEDEVDVQQPQEAMS